jgi:hypothetical protein
VILVRIFISEKNQWVLAKVKKKDELFFLEIRDWFGIPNQSLILCEHEFNLLTEKIPERFI